jgi:hypothetical protein
MSQPIVYGFPRSTFVNIVRLVLRTRTCPTPSTILKR